MFYVFQVLQDAMLEFMICRPFDTHKDILSVESCCITGGEQRVTLNRIYGGRMILRRGILLNHLWIYWSPNSEKWKEQLMIPCDVAQWNVFFETVNSATDLRPLHDGDVGVPKKRGFGSLFERKKKV